MNRQGPRRTMAGASFLASPQREKMASFTSVVIAVMFLVPTLLLMALQAFERHAVEPTAR